jgi:hypothetical protein
MINAFLGSLTLFPIIYFYWKNRVRANSKPRPEL